MRKQLRTLLCALCLMLSVALLVSGCSPDQSVEQEQAGEGKGIPQEIPIHPEAGWVTGGIAANGDTAFYLLAKEEPMAQDMRAAKLCTYDLESGEEEVVYEYTNDDGFYLNELEAVADCVFWVRTEGVQRAVERLDLATGDVQVIEQYGEGESDILLQSDGKYLTWYRLADGTASIRGYEIAKETLFDVAKEVSVAFPFIRANVIDGICAYAVDQGEETTIQVYDLTAKKLLQEIPVEKGAALFNITADRERCLYSFLREGVMDQRIFVYDYADGKETVVNEDESLYVFSWSYADGKLFLSERNANAIMVETMETGVTETLLNEQEHLYVLGSTTPDGSYLVLDAVNDAAPILTLIRVQ